MKKWLKTISAFLIVLIISLGFIYRNKISLLHDIYKNYSENNVIDINNISPDTKFDTIESDSDAEMNIQFKNTNNKPLTLDLYKAKKSLSSGSPVIIYVHGGSWAYGDKGIPSMLSPLLDSFRNEGYSILSISYELLDSNVNFYKQVSDVKDSIRWVYKNKNIYNFNTDEIGLIGISAGAHLSLLASYSDNNDFVDDLELSKYKSEVKYVVDFFGPTDLNTLDVTMASKELNISLDSIKDKDNLFYKYSPINYIKENLPNTLIIHSKKDSLVPYDNSLELYNKSKEKHNHVSLVTLEDMDHDLSNLSHEDSKKLAYKTLFFIMHNSPL